MKKQEFKNNRVNILQITDTHLSVSDELELFGVRSNIKFNEVIARIQEVEQSAVDLILLTGDISQDESEQSYQRVVDSLEKLNLPIYWIPGNHDDLIQMERIFKKSPLFHRVRNLSLPEWNLIFLNTKLDNSAEGYLSNEELQILSNEIQIAAPDKKIAVVMHHHPAAVGTPLIDKYILKNRDDFWGIVTGTQVNLIICGHVHGDYRFQYNDIHIESSPATCLQWQQGAVDLIVENKIGYKVYSFDKNAYKARSNIW